MTQENVGVLYKTGVTAWAQIRETEISYQKWDEKQRFVLRNSKNSEATDQSKISKSLAQY